MGSQWTYRERFGNRHLVPECHVHPETDDGDQRRDQVPEQREGYRHRELLDKVSELLLTRRLCPVDPLFLPSEELDKPDRADKLVEYAHTLIASGG